MAYDAETTTNDILDGVDLTGRRFVVTGASSGLGEESSRALAAARARVTMLARNPQKNEAAAERVCEAVPDADLQLGTVDLADLASIRSFTAGYLADHDAIDVLINNAGVMVCPFGRTADGFETQFGTNHLGHFLLTALLMPAIRSGDTPRVVNLSSGGHSISDVDLDDPNYESTEYDAWAAYGRSKTANALFTKELARRHGDELLTFAVHPGVVMTELGRHMDDQLMAQMMERLQQRSAAGGESDAQGGGMQIKAVEQGAATQIWAATAPELADHNGAYLGDCQVGVSGGNASHNGYEPYVDDADTAARLWTISEEFVGQAFP
jgi:NAD(P)-dependent dehydrogenase (short-subunit alcohol dehydrogenase family)